MKILYLLFALFFLVAQSSAQDSDRGIIGTAACFIRKGRCHFFRCPRRSRRIGRCARFFPCCRRR
ncbi:unnamed protein product, partial [Lepidochelys olivacea]